MLLGHYINHQGKSHKCLWVKVIFSTSWNGAGHVTHSNQKDINKPIKQRPRKGMLFLLLKSNTM